MLGQGPFGAYALGQPAPDLFVLSTLPGTFALEPKTASYALLRKITAQTDTYNISGVAISASYILGAGYGAFALHGFDATLSDGHKLTATAGAFTMTGYTSSGLLGFAHAPGAFVVTPQAAGVLYSRIFHVGTGAFTLQGQGAGLLQSHVLDAITGAYALSGMDATFKVTLNGDTGSFVWSRNEATLLHHSKLTAIKGVVSVADTGFTWLNLMRHPFRSLDAAPGAYILTPKAVQLRETHIEQHAAGAFTLTGNDAGLAKYDVPSLIAQAGAFTLAPQTASSNRAYVLTADVGSYSWGAQTAELLEQHKIFIAAGAYVLAAQTIDTHWKRVANLTVGGYTLIPGAVTLRRVYQLTVAAGAYTLVGQNAYEHAPPLTAVTGSFALAPKTANLLRTRLLNAATGRYLVNGSPAVRILAPTVGLLTLTARSATLTYRWTPMDAAAGSYTLSGQSATLQKIQPLSAAPGAFVVAAKTATLTPTHALAAGTGTFSMVAPNVELTVTRRIAASPGAIIVTAQPATFPRARVMTTLPGAFALTGFDADEISVPGNAKAYWRSARPQAQWIEPAIVSGDWDAPYGTGSFTEQ